MVYQKLNLADGEVLTAAHLAHIEGGIEAAKLFGAENAGKLLYINSDGEATILALGAGLQIVNGVLSVIGGSSGGDQGEVPDDPDDPTVVTLSVDSNGAATLSGATLMVDADGNATLTGAKLTVDANGNGVIA